MIPDTASVTICFYRVIGPSRYPKRRCSTLLDLTSVTRHAHRNQQAVSPRCRHQLYCQRVADVKRVGSKVVTHILDLIVMFQHFRLKPPQAALDIHNTAQTQTCPICTSRDIDDEKSISKRNVIPRRWKPAPEDREGCNRRFSGLKPNFSCSSVSKSGVI
ncbi:hypothetical protein BDR04DRAFT_334783 [Suillus decipiens]|nr:hypothetical protein BDR04DRAFT_334783 [Suillus decipiens]